MSNSWQAVHEDENDAQRITFYNPQQFEQPGVLQHGHNQQQAANQMAAQPLSSQSPPFSQPHSQYHYPSYDSGQSSVGQYDSQSQNFNWQQQGMHYGQAYPYNAHLVPQTSFSNCVMTNHPTQGVPQATASYAQYSQMQYEGPSHLLPQTHDEPIESQGDWNDIDLGRDPEEYNSSSSSEYGPEMGEQPMTSDYMDGFEAPGVSYPNPTAVEGFQQSCTSHPSACATAIDSNVPVNSNVPPPQPLPESLMNSTVHANHQSSQISVLPSEWFAPQISSDELSAVENITTAVDNLSVISTQQPYSGGCVPTSHQHIDFENRGEVRQSETTADYRNPENGVSIQKSARIPSNEGGESNPHSDVASGTPNDSIHESLRGLDTRESEQSFNESIDVVSSSFLGVQEIDALESPPKPQSDHQVTSNSQNLASQRQASAVQPPNFYEYQYGPNPCFPNELEAPAAPSLLNLSSPHGPVMDSSNPMHKDVVSEQLKNESAEENRILGQPSENPTNESHLPGYTSKHSDTDNPYQPRNSIQDSSERNTLPRNPEQMSETQMRTVSQSYGSVTSDVSVDRQLDSNPLISEAVTGPRALDAYPHTGVNAYPDISSANALNQSATQAQLSGNIPVQPVNRAQLGHVPVDGTAQFDTSPHTAIPSQHGVPPNAGVTAEPDLSNSANRTEFALPHQSTTPVQVKIPSQTCIQAQIGFPPQPAVPAQLNFTQPAISTPASTDSSISREFREQRTSSEMETRKDIKSESLPSHDTEQSFHVVSKQPSVERSGSSEVGVVNREVESHVNKQLLSQEEDERLQLQLRQLELEELEIERRKKLLSLQLEEQELKARKRELLQRKQGNMDRSTGSKVGIGESQATKKDTDKTSRGLISRNESELGNVSVTSDPSAKSHAQPPTPIQDQPRKDQSTLNRPDSAQQQPRKPGRTPVIGNVKPSEELRQIMSNMRPSPKKPPSVSSGRVPSRQSSVLSDKNSVDNSDLLSASRAGDFSSSQYHMLRQFGMPVDPYYGAAYQENRSRAGSEYGAPVDRSPSRGSGTSYEPWQQMYIQQQQAWYHHYHNNKRGETGYAGWPFANGWPSFEQWYHTMYMQQMYMQQNQWWEQYYSGGSFSASHGDTGYPAYPGYPAYHNFDPTSGWASADQHNPSGRRTPRRYLTAHCAVSLSLAGIMIQVSPNRPDEGEPARVQLLQLPIIDKEESKYVVFPGPLQRSETIPSDVRAFLRTKCEDFQRYLPSDIESAYLLIAYLELLIKNRGTVLGIDVVDLLLEGHSPKTVDIRTAGPLMRATSYESLVSLPPSGRSTPLSGMSNSGVPLSIKDPMANAINATTSQDKSLDDFRKLLLCGRRRQALHFACKHSLWGHALYLAQEMGPDILESTRSRFNKEAIHPHDPIQTYYQFCGRIIPEVSTNYSSINGNWGDWRPHLAMLVANQEENPELAATAIIQLGDSLAGQQLLFASQLCYLLAGCEFGRLDNKNAKISMISVDHRRIQAVSSVSDEAIQLTEVFEYAMTLAHRDFCIPSLQLYKFIYATRLLDAGLVEESFKYMSVIGSHLIRTPHFFPVALVDALLQLADRLQYHPACVHEYSRDWIEQLRSVRQYDQFGHALDKENAALRESEMITTRDQTDLNPDMRPNQSELSSRENNLSVPQQQHPYMNAQMQQQQNELHVQHTPHVPPMHQSAQYYQQPQPSNEEAVHSGLQQRSYQETTAQNIHQGSHLQNNVPGTDISSAHPSGGDRPPSASYQHHNIVSQTIHEQKMTANAVDESHRGSGEAVPLFNPAHGHPGGQVPTMQFFNPTNKLPASDSSPPSPTSPSGQTNEAFDYFSSVNQFAQPGRKRTMSGSSSSGGPSSPSASISLGQGAFKTYSRHSPTRSRTTSVASSGGQRSRHSSSADHQNMPPPSRPAPRKAPTTPMEQQQQSSQQQTSQPGSDGFMHDPNSSEPGNQKGVWKKLIGLLRPQNQNEVHLPDDKKPTIVWDDKKHEWVNQSGTEENSVVTAPPKLSQIPNPGEIRYRSGGIGGRGAAGRYVDVLASSKSTTASAGTSQAPPMLPTPPGQAMMSVAAPGPMTMPMPPMPPMSQNRAPDAPQPQFFVPGPPPSQPMPQ